MAPLVSTVTSAEDPRVAAFRGLPGRETGDDVIVEGALAVARLLESRHRVEALLATPSQAERLIPLLAAETPVLLAEAELLREIVGFDFHRGCIARTRRPGMEEAELDELVARLQAQPRLRIVAALGLADPVNLGAIVRTARAFAVDLVLCDARGADPFSRRAIRASMGNVFCLPVARVRAVGPTITDLRERLSASVVATVVDASAASISTLVWPRRALILFGNEGTGLPSDAVDLADLRLRIPIEASADSLNVASAAAIVLHRAHAE